MEKLPVMTTAAGVAEAILKASLKDAAKVAAADALSLAGPLVAAAGSAAAASGAEFLTGAVLRIVVGALAGRDDKLDRLLGSHFRAGIAEAHRALDVRGVSPADGIVRTQIFQSANHSLSLALEQKPENALLILAVRASLALEMGAFGFANSFCCQARGVAHDRARALSIELSGLSRALDQLGEPTGLGHHGGRRAMRKAIREVRSQLADLESIKDLLAGIESVVHAAL
jgi:hypothetical protein